MMTLMGADSWALIMFLGILVFVVPAALLIFAMPTWRSMLVALVMSGIAYTILMPIPNLPCDHAELCAQDLVVDNLMRPFVLICWLCLLLFATLKGLLLASRRRS